MTTKIINHLSNGIARKEHFKRLATFTEAGTGRTVYAGRVIGMPERNRNARLVLGNASEEHWLDLSDYQGAMGKHPDNPSQEYFISVVMAYPGSWIYFYHDEIFGGYPVTYGEIQPRCLIDKDFKRLFGWTAKTLEANMASYVA